MQALIDLKQDRQKLVDELTKAGARFKGNACNCPFHEDHRPSGGVFQETSGNWKFKCHSCGFYGDVFDVIAKRGNIPVPEAIKSTCGQTGAFGGKHGSNTPKAYSKAEIVDYLKTLGDVEKIYKYHTGKGEISFYVSRVKTFEGKTIRPFMPKDSGFVYGLPAAPRPLYNLLNVNKSDSVVIVEGEKCADCLNEYGIIATTSCGGAKNAGNSDFVPLAGKNCILWPDNDPEGKRYADDVQDILENIGARVSVINPADLGLKEADDVFDFVEQLKTVGFDKAGILAELQRVINSAKPKGITAKLSDKFDKIISGELQTVKLPFRWTSFLSSALLPGTLTIICGNVGASKSFKLLQCLIFWYRQNVKCCCFELEEDREFHLQRALSQLAENSKLTDFDYIKDNSGIARQAIAEHSDFLNNFGHCIEACPESQLTLSQIADWILTKAKQGNRIIAIDPITAAAQTRESWIADNAFLQNIKRTAVDYKCSIVLITHPIKAVSFADVTQLAGSAAYARFSQTILWLESHEPKQSNVETDCGTAETGHNRTLHILKSRNGTGQGKKLAFEFCCNSLTLQEKGLIRKTEK